jgi:predicted short-subunit dehydrogenase-like oxidoreductase (DUF2520 family)
VTLRVAVVGPGRAGKSLASALRAAGVDVAGLAGRGDRIPNANVILVTVRDGDLDAALGDLTSRGLEPGAIVLHASGVDDPAAALDALRAGGHPAGTFHPLVPLADPEAGAAALRNAWIGVDGDPPAVAAGEHLALRLGAHVLRIPRGAKSGYHAAAVIAANFPVVLAAAAERELRHAGVEAGPARSAVAHLMRTSIDHLAGLGPERALTGPVARGDVGTIVRNLAALADDPLLRDLYVTASRLAVDLARARGTVSAERLDEIERALGAP